MTDFHRPPRYGVVVTGWEDHLGTYIEYDFGGEPEITIDVAYDGSYAQRVIDNQLIEAQQKLGE